MDNLGNTLSNRRNAKFKCVPDPFCFFAYLPRRQNKMNDKSLPKVQLREFKKDSEYRLHHCLSKFDRSVLLNLSFFGVYVAWFVI